MTQDSITHEQRKKIFAMSRQAHIGNEELHHYLNDWAGVTSLSQGNCSKLQANKIIDSLGKIVVLRSAAQKKGKMTDKQFRAIYSLQRALQWNDARLRGFTYHTVEKYDTTELSVIEASKLITGLRQMYAALKKVTHNKN